MNRLKRRLWIPVLAIGVAASSVWVHGQMADTRPVASLLPSGALLYVEAKDFHRLLTEWNGSEEKKKWLASRNFQELSLSRLIQRLAQAGGEFQAAGDIRIGMNFADQMAGTRSGFAFYNFSDVSFVYLTQMPQTGIENTELWRNRAGYESREAAGVPFYVKADAKSGRKVAFAAYKGWLVLATDEERMAQTLVLLAGGKAPALAGEEWFTAAIRQRSEAGDLRLVYDMPALLRTPQYRTYWLHRNATELKPFASGVADLFEREDGFQEERALLRQSQTPVTPTTGLLNEVTGYAPQGGGSLLRAWKNPEADQIAGAVEQVVLGEKPGRHGNAFDPAPGVTVEGGVVGSEGDLEIRIDEPPFQRPSQQPITPLLKALVTMQPTALAHVQMTAVLRDQVFVMPQSAVVLLCQKPDRAALDQALAQVSNTLQAGSLDPLSVSVTGKIVTLSRVSLTQGEPSVNVDSSVTYLAVYDHQAEWPRYKRLFSVLDQTSQTTQPGLSASTPAFFSSNVASLGDSLGRLQRASIVSSDTGSTVGETIHYKMAKP